VFVGGESDGFVSNQGLYHLRPVWHIRGTPLDKEPTYAKKRSKPLLQNVLKNDEAQLTEVKNHYG
jgi:hypothetical protein